MRLLPFAACFAAVTAGSTLCLADPPRSRPAEPRMIDARPAVLTVPRLELEADGTPGGAAASPFATGPTPAAGSVLTAPVTLNANTPVTSDAFTSTQTGAGRAITGIINKTGNIVSAIKGQTNGSGAGVNGVNIGTTGPAGKFQVTGATNSQPAVAATTSGTGNVVQAVNSNTGTFDSPALLGQHNGNSAYGIGVEGDGGYMGVRGVGNYFGLYGSSVSGYGVYATSGATGVYGASSGSAGIGVYGINTSSGYAGFFNGTGGVGLYARTGNPSGSYAGIFDGPVNVGGPLYANSFNVSSDRAVKQGFHGIDGNELLQRLDELPIGGWEYQATPGIRHVGPMAQDFKAAFGLGADDRHIDMVDAAGVNLAAIQALQRQLKAKDARIDALEARNAATEAKVELLGALSQTVQALQAQLAAMAPGPTPAATVAASVQP